MINKKLPCDELINLAESIIHDAYIISEISRHLSGARTTLSKSDKEHLGDIKSDKDKVAAYLIDWCWAIKRNTDTIKEKIWAWQDKK